MPTSSPVHQTAYDDRFFEAMDHDARRSAQVILTLLSGALEIKSVVDFGCGNGEWLRVWKSLGVNDTLGIDGEFIRRERLLIEPTEFQAKDLQASVRLGRTFDLVQSLEVAEHLPDSCADDFVDSLVAHGDTILFSAAVKGQMGIQHVNEQPYEYWRNKFAQRGFVLFDWIRPQIEDKHEIAFWYRYNVLLFVRDSKLEKLPQEVQQTRIAEHAPVPDWSPISFRFRRGFTQCLPVAWVDRLVQFCHRLESRRRVANEDD